MRSGRITITSGTSELINARKAVTDFIGGELDEMETGRVVLAIDEALANIIIHGYGPESSGAIDLEMESDAESIVFTITDSAPEFNPIKNPLRPPDEYINSTGPGGLGIDIFRRIMDVSYERDKNGINRLIMVKRKNKKN